MKTAIHSCKNIVTRSATANARLTSTHPWAQAMLDVLQRRGRSYGLLALYEESRLSTHR